VGRPAPPERGEHQEPVLEPTPCRIVRQQRRHLCEPEDEDEIEEQLQWRNPMLVIRVLLGHGRTLARRLGDRFPTSAVQASDQSRSTGATSRRAASARAVREYRVLTRSLPV